MSVSARIDASVAKTAMPEDVEHIPFDDVVSLYFKQMSSEPLLTREQEINLAKRIDFSRKSQEALAENPPSCQAGRARLQQYIEQGQIARKHMAQANTRLVISIAKRYRNAGLPLMDLIQEGNVGLMLAVDKFDHGRGNRFSTYATWWIRQAIIRGLSKKSRTIRLPMQVSDTLRQIRQARITLEQHLGRHPTQEEISVQTGLPVARLEDLMPLDRQIVALEEPVGEESELQDFLVDEDAPILDEAADLHLLIDLIATALDSLKPQEALILRLRYGLDGFKPQTLETIGRVVGLSRERIRQIEHQALWRLRSSAYANHLHDFVA